MIRALRSRLALEVWVCALLIGLGGVTFVAAALFRLWTEGGVGVLSFPIALCVLELIAVAGLVSGWRWARPVVLVIVMLGALLHLLVALGNGADWTRAISAVLVAAQVYALVLLNTKPIREHFGITNEP